MEKTVVELFAGVGGFRCGFNNVSLIDNEVIEEDKENKLCLKANKSRSKIR